MTAAISSTEEAVSYDLNQVIDILATETNAATMVMVQALMAGLTEKLDFKGLANKHITDISKAEIANLDERTRRVFNKLVAAVQDHINANSPQLKMTLNYIHIQTGSAEAPLDFIGAFALPATRALVTKLDKEQPGAIDEVKIWA